jgi:hypothetical protein
MRRIVITLIAALLLSAGCRAQANHATADQKEAAAPALVVQPMPAELLHRSQSLHAELKPAVATWVAEQAKNIASQASPDLDELRDGIRKRFATSLQSGGANATGPAAGAGNNMAVEAMVLTVLMEAAQDADQDLQTQMQQMQALTKAKEQIRAVLNEMSRPMSSLAGSDRSAVCDSEFCRSLPAKLAAINAATANLPHPSYLPVPSKVTAEDVANSQAALQNDLDSDNEIREMGQTQLQMLMDRRSKLLETVSNIEKSVSDTDAAIVSNLK